MFTEQIVYAFGWGPWSSIIAGCVSALAISVILAVLGVALGFTVVSPKSDDPASGLGLAFGIWGGISILISVAAGGFIAGFLAGQRGLEVGFLVWALTVIGAMFVSGAAIGTLLKLIGAAVANIGSGAAAVAGGMGKSAAHAAAGLFGEIKDTIHLDFNTEKFNEHVRDVLRDTEVETLQPEYLRAQMREMKSEAKKMLYQMTLNPSDHKHMVTDFLDDTMYRLETLTQNVNRDVAVSTLARNRNIPCEDAAKLVHNALRAYDQVLAGTRDALAEAKTQMEGVGSQLKHLADQTRVKADKLASAAAKTALCAALALILAAVISMWAGHYGASYAASLLPEVGLEQIIPIPILP